MNVQDRFIQLATAKGKAAYADTHAQCVMMSRSSVDRFNVVQLNPDDLPTTLANLAGSTGAGTTIGRSINPVPAYAVDGAVLLIQGTSALTKGSIGAYTLAAPTAAQEGLEINITSGSAFAHVVTATGLLNDGVTGGAKNTATFAAFVGATITLVAYNLKWNVISKNVVTVA